MSDPSSFYTGLVADLYGPLKSARQPAAPYAAFVQECGEPALELGCGGGEPLLELRAMGLDVEGLDSSIDMLDKCGDEARERGLEVALHHTSMADFDLERRYRSIYLAGPTFNLLPDDDAACAALRRIAAHLAEDGAALIPLFIPQPTPASTLGAFREVTTSDGAVLRFAILSETRDEDARTQTSVLRYERVAGGRTEALERPWVLHWHTQDGFRLLAEQADLRVVSVSDYQGNPVEPDAGAFVFRLTA